MADLRRRESAPILDAIREYMDLVLDAALPQSPFGKAVTYALNQWPASVRREDDGRLSIDNNAAKLRLSSAARRSADQPT